MIQSKHRRYQMTLIWYPLSTTIVLHFIQILRYGWRAGTLQWWHNEGDGVSNHRRHDCLFNCLFRRRSKKASKPSVTGLCKGNSPVTGVNPPYKGPVTREIFYMITPSWFAQRSKNLTAPHHWPLCERSWWRHQMETFSALLAICAGNSPVTGELPAQRPVTRSFDVFFDLRLNKRLSKQWRGRWFETPSRSWWRHCNDLIVTAVSMPLRHHVGVSKSSILDSSYVWVYVCKAIRMT